MDKAYPTVFGISRGITHKNTKKMSWIKPTVKEIGLLQDLYEIELGL